MRFHFLTTISYIAGAIFIGCGGPKEGDRSSTDSDESSEQGVTVHEFTREANYASHLTVFKHFGFSTLNENNVYGTDIGIQFRGKEVPVFFSGVGCSWNSI